MEKITEKTFAEKISSGVVMVACTAKWCQPCKIQKPILETLSAQKKDLTIFTLDIDEEPEVATMYDVASIPTFIWFVDGELRQKDFGVKKATELLSIFEKLKS